MLDTYYKRYGGFEILGFRVETAIIFYLERNILFIKFWFKKISNFEIIFYSGGHLIKCLYTL